MEKQDKRSARIDPSIQVPSSINFLLPKTLFCLYAHTPHRNLENELGLKLFFMLKFMQIKESASSAFFLSKCGVRSYVLGNDCCYSPCPPFCLPYTSALARHKR